jgi:RNA polymerase sigma-70 factor (ECF subfamily)
MTEAPRGSLEPITPAMLKLHYVRHAGPLRLFLIRFLSGDRAGAEDLVQQAFLTAWERRAQLRSAQAFKPWLYSIAVNLARGRMRARRDETGGEPDPVSPGPGPEAAASSAQGVARIRAALDALPPDQRESIILVRLEGMTFAQAAEALGAPENTVKTWVRRGLLRLADVLDGA